ncbi:acetoacetate--CoA ligase [Hoeflea prorocentri]|uniref:Acetoacetate--CoA ligase n=1 Tax=Hoeflea prorocentri TaxID=1922333 RepID=A0A9X3ZJA9_9HYPH|nr:acetoacetate--CoA ligase [Hoeflea prorocentri]MCY6383264.1 acetoacetate--CoA ligase [Hoeflea prorocentri]MDA5401064.1 acetoacetate--CoA ligase [Hoeflea prorocentri]
MNADNLAQGESSSGGGRDNDVLWMPTVAQRKETALWQFAEENGFDPEDYDTLHRWSISQKGAFWSAVWDFCGVVGEPGDAAFQKDEAAWMTGARFFPDAHLNLAENLLRSDGADTSVIAIDEAGGRKDVLRKELISRVARVAAGLREAGVRMGDRVAGVQPNNVDALVALLATLSLGAVWTSCSPDFGKTAIVDRIGQVAPKVLFAAARYRYGGKDHDVGERIAEVVGEIPSITTLVLSGEGDIPGVAFVRQDVFGGDGPPEFTRVPFDHPAYILYTSGTTGIPKAIVHRTGGVLMQHLKEHVLHGDVRRGDRLIWYTNTAWMMYHWTVSALAARATIVLYDGAPILKADNGLDCTPLWNLADSADVTHLGVSPKYLATLAAEGYLPRVRHKLSALRSLLVCGAPTLPHQFDWVYRSIKRDMSFSSISGGTEILGSFLIGSPIHPVRRGQLTVPALGHAVSVLDDRGAAVVGERGALVCTEPFPSMPLTFWGEGGDERYRDTYFSARAEIWTHGDVAELTYTGGGYVHGRADNTLKPGGVRIGISEIYAVCESYPDFEDFLVFGALHDGDEEVVLCLKPAEGVTVTPDLVKTLRRDIRTQASPRHVPARVHVVSDVPYTVNGKRVESAARTTVAGETVKNLGSIANPDCLAEYAGLKRDASL